MDYINVGRKVHEFTRAILEMFELDSASIFICDRMSARPRLSYLLHLGITGEAQDQYDRKSVFLDDPYTSPELQERRDGADGIQLLTPAGCRVKPIVERSGRYNQFMSHHGLKVIAVSTRRLLPGVYSTIGFHRRQPGERRDDVSISQLDDLASRLQDMVAGQILRDLLNCASGVSAFYSSCFGRVDATSSRPLSPREKEIATLVCQGRLNKEIAYLVGLSENTVENHLRRIYAKLAIRNRCSLVALMNRHTSAAVFKSGGLLEEASTSGKLDSVRPRHVSSPHKGA